MKQRSLNTSGVAEHVAPTHDDRSDRRTFDYDRTVALSDGVFAIALTLLVLNIGVPVLARSNQGELASRLLDRSGEFASYALSFAVIAFLWVRHHGFFRALTRIDGTITLLNLAYLGFVAFLPYPTRILGLYGSRPAAVVLYSSSLAIVTTIAGLMRVYALRAGIVSDAGSRDLAEREHWTIRPAIFVASAGVAFADPAVAKLLWLLLLLTPRLGGSRAAARDA